MNEAMKVDHAVAYLAGRGIRISRRSFYNWIKTGLGGTKLQHSTVPNAHPTAKDREVVVVTPDQLETFLNAVGVRGCR